MSLASDIQIPWYLCEKRLPTNQGNIISVLSEKYGWKTYGDINLIELKKVYGQDFAHFWTIIKYLTFQGVEFSGKLKRFSFSNVNGKRDLLFLNPNEENSLLDYDYHFAFLKIQLLPFGIFEKYDLHLVPLHHLINQHWVLDEVKDFFLKEGFQILSKETINKYKNNLSTLLNDTEKKMSIEKSISFLVGENKYTLSSDMKDFSLLSDTLPSSKILKVLLQRGYKRVSDLPYDMSFLLDIPHVAQRSVEKFFHSIGEHYLSDGNTPIKKKVYSFRGISEKGYFIYEEEQISLSKEVMTIPLEENIFGIDLIKLFAEYNIKMLGDLPFELENFLKVNGYKKVERRKITSKIFEQLPVACLEDLFFLSLKPFVENEKPSTIGNREWNILLQRLKGKTLQEIAKDFNLTRERIRQISAKSLNKMFDRYEKYFSYIEKQLRKNSFVNIFDFFSKREVTYIEKAASFFNIYGLPFRVYGNYMTLDERDIFDEKIKAFQTKITEGHNEIYKYTREEIESYILSYFSANNIESFRKLSEEFIADFFEKVEENKFLYKHKLTKARMCQLVFEKEFAEGLEIYKQKDLFIKKLLEYYPEEFKNDTSRSILANLTRDEDIIILWKLGYFKHISTVHPNVSEKTLTPIKEWLLSKLSDNLNQINTKAAFNVYGDLLMSLEIDSEHALFSLLKIYFPETFNYSRSPTLVKVGYERAEKRKLIEEFVKSFDGYVSNEEIIKHFVGTMGWTKTMVDQNIYSSENLLKTSDGLIHVKNLDFKMKELDKIFEYAKQKILELQNSYSVETIYEERKSTLLQMGIKDGRVLYELLERNYSDEFDFTRYPHIHPAGKYHADQLSIVGQFETYFLENDDYFLRDELYEEFVIERGWAMSSYYMAYAKCKGRILEVYPDEFAHIEFIEWNKEKAERLIRILENFLSENDNKPFIHIQREIISNDDLIKEFPEINPQLDWNHTLLVSILEITDAFILLGSKKVGILSKHNKFGIESEHEFLAYLLKNKYDGYVKLADLQKYLYSIDMCGKSNIPNYYLTSSEKELEYLVVNDEIILKELMVRE